MFYFLLLLFVSLNLQNLTLASLFQWASGYVFVMTIFNMLLPPWEFFSDYPRFQSKYKLFVTIIKYWGSLDFKSKIYPQIAQHNTAAAAVNNFAQEEIHPTVVGAIDPTKKN